MTGITYSITEFVPLTLIAGCVDNRDVLIPVPQAEQHLSNYSRFNQCAN